MVDDIEVFLKGLTVPQRVALRFPAKCKADVTDQTYGFKSGSFGARLAIVPAEEITAGKHVWFIHVTHRVRHPSPHVRDRGIRKLIQKSEQIAVRLVSGVGVGITVEGMSRIDNGHVVAAGLKPLTPQEEEIIAKLSAKKAKCENLMNVARCKKYSA